ncbi:GGDEF domain-containing protein [Stutzerimonas stutzeri]|uniref:GGDEF domain-containing protein n=1 Tax=Stutzerimonas sp. S1 TaxID=3030652 RepID=UPI0022243C28|nr:GGDEF domain-containing protein [Stutzerimonas sp. S1]MCW3149962.1 GGDEF domain-containing protein [Stutzerimonas sp. S1]
MKLLRQPVDLLQLSQMRLMQQVDAACLRRLVDRFETCEMAADEVLLSPHGINRFLYLLVDGELTVYLDSLDSQPLRLIEPCECVGEVSFIDRHPPSTYIVATQPSRLLRLHSREFAQLTTSPQLMQNLVDLLCERVRLGERLIINSEHNANVDMLTGVFNRRWLEHIFERERARCAFNQVPLCLLMLDVDRFKAYNDKHGHLAGDHALCLVARTLGSQLRPKDSLVRFGGEEFVILLPELGLHEARQIGERLLHSVEQIASFNTAIGLLPGVTISIGLAQLRAEDELEDLIDRADKALYQAKQQGRNRLCG